MASYNRDKSKYFNNMQLLESDTEHAIINRTIYTLKFYPFTRKKKFNSWLTGKVDLTKLSDPTNSVNSNIAKLYKRKSTDRLVAEIFAELNRAELYLSSERSNWEAFDRQRLEARVLSRMISSGHADWDPKYKKCSAAERKRLAHKMNPKADEAFIKLHMHNIKEHGLYTTYFKPLIARSSDGKDRYNYCRREIEAMHLLIAEYAFENLC